MDGTGKNLTQMGITSLRIIPSPNKEKRMYKEINKTYEISKKKERSQ